MGELLTRSSSTCSTTLQISSTRLLSCLRAGPAPRQNLRVRRMFCWLRERRRGSGLLDEFLFRFWSWYFQDFSTSLSDEGWCFYLLAAEVGCCRWEVSSV